MCYDSREEQSQGPLSELQMESWIAQMCQKRARRQVLAWLVVFLIGVTFVCSNGRYVRNFARGPFALQPAALAQISDIETAPEYFVSVESDKILDTGIQEVTTTTRNGVKESSRVSGGYYAVVLGDRFLIVKSSIKPLSRVSGELAAIPADLSSQLFSGVDGRRFQEACYPFYLETEGFRYPGYWAIGITWLFVGLFWKFGRPAWTQWRDVSTHPVVKRVAQWSDPVAASEDVKRELKDSVLYKSNGIRITNKYIVRKRFFTFNVLQFEDLLWAYKKVTQRYTYFIPTGRSFAAILIFYGGGETFPGNERRVDEVLARAVSVAPWAVVGYSSEINDLFSKRTTEFCQAVEARREEASSRVVR